MKPTRFVMFSPDELEDLKSASAAGTFSYTFDPAEIKALEDGTQNVTLDLVVKARRVVNEVQMKKTVAKAEFVERGELKGYVSLAEFRVLQAALEALTTKFFLTFKLLEKKGNVSEKEILALSQVIVKDEVKTRRKKK